ncbi:hypothetical protein HMF3257_38705 [Spirosoma telluris]|uniref:Uncharacterized protein n=2 Tax=Spirosoma telluris TaxID=2183553 RepID=A0A327NJW4_9BACT|nr:hypothetical protein HMF3257_38705 [Spirosoma telluris]
MYFSVRDNGDGDPFNANLRANIWYFPTSTSDDSIYDEFGDPRTHSDWNPKPTKPAKTRLIRNRVNKSNYDAQPGKFRIKVKTGFKLAIVWTFLDANQTARPTYRHPLSVYQARQPDQAKHTR